MNLSTETWLLLLFISLKVSLEYSVKISSLTEADGEVHKQDIEYKVYFA